MEWQVDGLACPALSVVWQVGGVGRLCYFRLEFKSLIWPSSIKSGWWTDLSSTTHFVNPNLTLSVSRNIMFYE